MSGTVCAETIESEPPTVGGLSTDRLIGSYAGEADGPLLICVGGLHGNEPAGVLALRRVFRTLEDRSPPLRGEIVGIAGNLRALREGTRYVQRDLNRGWTRRTVETAKSAPEAGEDAETVEQRELLAILREVLARATGAVYVVDLHTTSAESAPFLTLGDTLRNRAFARRIPLPMVLGIEEQIDGAMLEYLNGHGAVTVGIEAGRHDAASSVDRHVWSLWSAMIATGNLDPVSMPDVGEVETRLREAWRGLSRVFEVRHRKPVVDGDGFLMRPGFRNFQPIQEGEQLAEELGGAITAPESGQLFLPRYQEQGDDGFFIVRPVSPFWLRVSAALRRIRADRIAHWLPGVHRKREHPGHLFADRKVARWYAVEIFHLLGFRRRREAGEYVVFRRRKYDFKQPDRLDEV